MAISCCMFVTDMDYLGTTCGDPESKQFVLSFSFRWKICQGLILWLIYLVGCNLPCLELCVCICGFIDLGNLCITYSVSKINFCCHFYLVVAILWKKTSVCYPMLRARCQFDGRIITVTQVVLSDSNDRILCCFSSSWCVFWVGSRRDAYRLLRLLFSCLQHSWIGQVCLLHVSLWYGLLQFHRIQLLCAGWAKKVNQPFYPYLDYSLVGMSVLVHPVCFSKIFNQNDVRYNVMYGTCDNHWDIQ